MAQGYGYGNARLRAMRSRLLTESDYDDLLGKATVEEIITRLAETPYKTDVEAAMVRFDGVRCVFEAVRANLARTLSRVREYYEGEPAALVDVLLRHWDRHNLLTILRAQMQHSPSESVLSATVPIGQVDAVSLGELARQPGIQAAIDLMILWRLPYAAAIKGVQPRSASIPDLDELELALNRCHYASIRETLGQGDGNRGLVREHIQTEIDLANISTVLRLVRLPELAPLVRQRYHTADVRPLLIDPGGHISTERLAALVSAANGVRRCGAGAERYALWVGVAGRLAALPGGRRRDHGARARVGTLAGHSKRRHVRPKPAEHRHPDRLPGLQRSRGRQHPSHRPGRGAEHAARPGAP